MILYIDTTSEDTKIELISIDVVVDSFVWKAGFNQSELLLKEIDTLLIKNGLKQNDLKGISVNSGPGSYTGMRIGITTANFLALSLNIPITNQKNLLIEDNFTDFVLPIYANSPHITIPKKKN